MFHHPLWDRTQVWNYAYPCMLPVFVRAATWMIWVVASYLMAFTTAVKFVCLALYIGCNWMWRKQKKILFTTCFPFNFHLMCWIVFLFFTYFQIPGARKPLGFGWFSFLSLAETLSSPLRCRNFLQCFSCMFKIPRHPYKLHPPYLTYSIPAIPFPQLRFEVSWDEHALCTT